MKERPILFSGPMVKAILEGRKTQTRRVIKPQPFFNQAGYLAWETSGCLQNMGRSAETMLATHCPYGQQGDRLWVRETWQYLDWTEDGEPYIAYAADGRNILKRPSEEWYEKVQDIWAELSAYENYKIERRASDKRWRPSIHMPRWASRITLEITGIRVERLQDISEEDARAEGIEREFAHNIDLGWKNYLWHGHFGQYGMGNKKSDAWPHQYSTYRDGNAAGSYSSLWESINGPGSWDANPWVWVIEFKPVSKMFPSTEKSENSTAKSDK